jgi:hypothetical protein
MLFGSDTQKMRIIRLGRIWLGISFPDVRLSVSLDETHK